MDQLFNLIMDNIFFVVIIIGVLLKMLGGSKAKEEAERSNEQQANPPEDNQPKSVFQQVKAEIEQQKQSQNMKQQAQPVVSVSVEDQQKAQLDRLKQSYQTGSKKDNAFDLITKNSSTVSRKEITDSEEISLNLDERLSQKGLIESVIMAEVLGSPRALKPYRNVTSNRYR